MGVAGGVRATLELLTLPALVEAAVQLGTSTVYVVSCPGLDLDAGEGWSIDPAGEGAGGRPWRYRLVNATSGLVGWVVLLEYDNGRESGPWRGLDGAELLRAFAQWERQTGATWSTSVGTSAERLLISKHPRSRGGVQLERVELPEAARRASLEGAFTSWTRPATADERGRGWLIAIDANAQYLSAWITAELGTGRPVHHRAPRFDPKAPGIWRIPGAANLGNPMPAFPAPWLEGREWFTTPTVVRMLEWCDGLELPVPLVDEAWVWPTRSRWLRGAGETLRDLRKVARQAVADAQSDARGAQSLEDASGAVSRVVTWTVLSEAAKAVYTRETGRLGAELPHRADSPWYRPDWAATIHAQARVNLHRAITKHGQLQPVAIDHDMVVYLSDSPDPTSTGLPIGDGLGQFKHVASVLGADDGWRETLEAGWTSIRTAIDLGKREAVPVG